MADDYETQGLEEYEEIPEMDEEVNARDDLDEPADFGEESFIQRYKSLFVWAFLGSVLVFFTVYQLLQLFEGPAEAVEQQTTAAQFQPVKKVEQKPAGPAKAQQAKQQQAAAKAETPKPEAQEELKSTALEEEAQPAVQSLPSAQASIPAAPAAPSAEPQPVVVQPGLMPSAQAVAQQQPGATFAPAPVPASLPVDVNDKLTELDDVLEKQQEQMSEHQETNAAQFKEVQAKLDEITQSLSKLQSSASKPSTAPARKVVRKTATKPKATTVKKAVTAPSKAADSSTMPYTYYVKAVVPGRAWIQVGPDQSMSVGIGDYIPGLGRVTKIDAKHGMVATSSGRIIPFGIEAN